MKSFLAVFRKELVDALRDRRTLLVVLMSGVVIGPLMLVALSSVIASMEAQRSTREVYIVGIERAPTLRNFIERQTYAIKAPPADYEEGLRKSKFNHPVVVIADGFEAALLHGDKPLVEVVSDSSNRVASSAEDVVIVLLQGFVRERLTLGLALRGVSPQVADTVDIEQRDLASEAVRGSGATSLVPFFIILAVLSGAINGALDTTAGERERGSLEPLLMNPVGHVALVLGKWAAVASVSMLIAVLSSASFLPTQALLRSDTLQAIFRYGWREAGLFIALMLPLAAAMAAGLMAVAIRCKTVKEAQANTTVVALAVSMLPIMTMLNESGEAGWHFWVPVLAQNSLMTRVLRGEAFGWQQLVVPCVVCTLLTIAGVTFVASRLRQAAVQ